MTDDVLAPDAAEQDKSADQASATTEPDEGAASPQAAPRRKRRILKRIAIWAVSTVVVLALLLAGLLTWEIRRAFPQYDGALHVTGLSAPVKVYRDSHAIPQLFAQNADDLFRAQGYVTAQERFWGDGLPPSANAARRKSNKPKTHLRCFTDCATRILSNARRSPAARRVSRRALHRRTNVMRRRPGRPPAGDSPRS